MGFSFGGGGGSGGANATGTFQRNDRIFTQEDSTATLPTTTTTDNTTVVNPTNTVTTAPTPTTYPSAGGGFLGQTPFGTPVEKFGTLPSQQAAYNPAYAGMSGGNLAGKTYRQIMKRAPDLLTQQGLQTQMEQGLTGQGLVGALTSSPEFQRQQEVSRAYTEAFRPGYQEFGPSGQYYQPIYQPSYTNYSQSPFFYQPSYGASLMSPSMMGYGFGSFNPNPFSYGGRGGFGGMGGYGGYGYAEGGEIEDEGIAALRNT